MTRERDGSVVELAALLLHDHERAQTVRALAFCRGCQAQFDSRKPCPRCTAFAERRPWRHEEVR